MIKALIVGCFLLFNSLASFSQESKINFVLDGYVDIDTGSVSFVLVSDSGYYPDKMRDLKARVLGGKFHIEAFIEEPLAYEISVSDGAPSGVFVIDTGKQTIRIHSKARKAIPQVTNKIMVSDYESYLKSFEKVRLNNQLFDRKRDSLSVVYSNNIPTEIRTQLDQELKLNYREHDAALLKYVRENPTSYYALWKLIALTKFGYEEIFSTIYDHFSDSLKNSKIGLKVGNHLSEFNLTALNSKLKSFSATDVTANKNTHINYKANKYTLLDFWYSNCAPCIAKFPDLAKIYEDFRLKGLEIIGISTDKLSRKENWQKVISDQNLQWPQLLDVNGVESLKLGISVFPSNFLINNSGEIVGVNMLPSELRTYLENH
ncbi:peroxiredoxin [Arcticibacter pallidicorallinus]|uniref:Peroxiredoxin n=1 Tax=Arcticibacter pallidicorallinus TaxID=1259464 RepID=A0A2T0U4H1_9SPHI|nr:TlpA disulfide reductase family protein [Arcticibacter pallidicorallinus]PRY52784.1 peroxiredoxin [Arcticibacter pallidicorallinus]